MRAVRLHEYGGPEVLRAEETPAPEPGEGELLIEVDAVGVTLPVVRATRGESGVPLPHIPGGEIVGRVAGIGRGVSGRRVGERVAGLAFSGAYAETVAVPAVMVTAVPDDVDDLAALALTRSGQVALGALRAGGFAEGDSVLVTAAAGGVGHLAVQLAAALGAGRVTAAVGDAAKAGFAREQGAGHVVTYDQDDWGDPVDVVLDGVGGQVQDAGLRALAPLGRLVAFNAVGGTVDTNALRMRGTSVIGFAVAHLAARRRDTYERHQRELWELHRDGHLRPVVHEAMPLERAADAHRLIEARANRGKIVLLAR
ncbi:quinone oxidoreductase family protein [Actinoallomurus soli]|uniref:quinone oxidoreductase family protein n=1 Tax=Actinoallomurus soli TaxID=2952535 RepID=UPI002093B3E0|nr:zinc-binding dehydrogenase [Actinoallomurus soli]MCO5972338.1 zinc-binding dehydrogenase [Actinoallomurus soli]